MYHYSIKRISIYQFIYLMSGAAIEALVLRRNVSIPLNTHINSKKQKHVFALNQLSSINSYNRSHSNTVPCMFVSGQDYYLGAVPCLSTAHFPVQYG